MPIVVAGLSRRVRWILVTIILFSVGTAIVAALNSSMLLAISRVTAKSPYPPPLSRSVAATAAQKKPGIKDTPCTEEGIAELIKLLAKRRGSFIVDYRIPAAKRLGDCGAAAALPALEKMSKDKDPEVKAAALEAISKIKKAN